MGPTTPLPPSTLPPLSPLSTLPPLSPPLASSTVVLPPTVLLTVFPSLTASLTALSSLKSILEQIDCDATSSHSKVTTYKQYLSGLYSNQYRENSFGCASQGACHRPAMGV